MSLKSELLTLLKEDSGFRMQVTNLLADELSCLLTVDVQTHGTRDDEYAISEVEVDVSFRDINSSDLESTFRNELNPIITNGFSKFWKNVPTDLKKREESCKKLFSKLCIREFNKDINFESINNIKKYITSFIIDYNCSNVRNTTLPIDYLQNKIDNIEKNEK